MPVVAIIIILVVGTASFVNTILCHKLACHTTGLEPISSYGMFVNRSQKTDLWWLREAEYFTSLITFSTEKQQHQSLSPLNITNQNCTQHTHIILMAIFQMDLVNQLILHF